MKTEKHVVVFVGVERSLLVRVVSSHVKISADHCHRSHQIDWFLTFHDYFCPSLQLEILQVC